jgi:hypothetical protein
MTFINKLYFSFRNSFACRLPRFYNFCETKKSVVKFMIAGCIAGGTHLVFLAIFYDLFNWPIVLSTSVLPLFLAFVTVFLCRNYGHLEILVQKERLDNFLCIL